MKSAYGVTWREHDDEQAGRLTIGAHGIEFTACDDERVATQELAFDEIAAVELHPRHDPTRPPVVVVAASDGRELEIASAADGWIIAELLTRMLTHSLSGSQSRRQILAAVKLKPDCRLAAEQLLAAGPPFDPAGTALTLHEVYLLADEALFLFEARGDEVAHVADLDLWRAAAAWRELTTGEVRLAEPVYRWGQPEQHEAHPGLGF